MKIFITSDHAGYELKSKLVEFLKGRGHEVDDMGPHQLAPADDYPDMVAPLARAVVLNPGSFGIVLGASGQGEAISANRIWGARTAVFYGGPSEILKLSRQHNDANILSLGARFVDAKAAMAAVELWLATPFSHEERHARRIDKLDHE